MLRDRICSSRRWRNEGVDRIFGVPGEENLDVVESLSGSKIQLVLTRHEQAAGVHGGDLRPAHRQAGRVHLDARARRAEFLDRRGLRAARRHADDHDHRPEGDHDSPQARFQIVDVVASMKPLTKLTRQIVARPRIPTIVRDAFRVAEEERPGPVHLELPEDIAAEETPGKCRWCRRIRSRSRWRMRRRSTARPR